MRGSFVASWINESLLSRSFTLDFRVSVSSRDLGRARSIGHASLDIGIGYEPGSERAWPRYRASCPWRRRSPGGQWRLYRLWWQGTASPQSTASWYFILGIFSLSLFLFFFLFVSSVSPSFSPVSLSPSLSSVSFTSHSPRLRGSYCYRRVRGHQRAREEERRLCREEESWTTLRRILVNAERARLSRIPRQVPAEVREKEFGGGKRGRVRLVASGYLRDIRGVFAVLQDARSAAMHITHHRSCRNGNDTNGTTPDSPRRKARAGEPREQGERTGPQVGMDS